MIQDRPETPRTYTSSLLAVFVSFILLSFHAYVIFYINSTFIEQFIQARYVGLLFSAGSILTLLILFYAPTAIRRFGAYSITLFLLVLELIMVLLLSFVSIPPIVLISFVLYRGVLVSLVYFFDLFLENASRIEEKTGRIRSLYLSLSNTALIISPTIAGFLLGETENYTRVYLFSSFFIIPTLLITARYLRKDSVEIVAHDGMSHAIQTFKQNKDLRNVLWTRILLQLFYAVMVIYTPVYLYTVLGFTWQIIGLMLTIMLLPFLLFQIPAGYLADTRFGEQELMVIGFIIIGFSTIIFALIQTPIFFFLAATLFVTRVGASLVEIMTESYFFKHVNQNNSNIISVFRGTEPVAYIIGPLLATPILIFGTFEHLFIATGLLMFLGILFSLRIADTK